MTELTWLVVLTVVMVYSAIRITVGMIIQDIDSIIEYSAMFGLSYLAWSRLVREMEMNNERGGNDVQV